MYTEDLIHLKFFLLNKIPTIKYQILLIFIKADRLSKVVIINYWEGECLAGKTWAQPGGVLLKVILKLYWWLI